MLTYATERKCRLAKKLNDRTDQKEDKMFTGIIEEIGTVRSIYGGNTGTVLDIEAGLVLDGTCKGDSIAVNGVCLTVTPERGHFTADAMPETLRRTSLGRLRPGSKVNLERAMLCGGRFGGHMVSGHVDACGEIISMTRDGIATLMRISAPYEILRYTAVKGSITVDGTSLTIAGTDKASLTVSLIPHTAQNTTLGLLHPGSQVNLEVDMLARYVERLMAFPAGGDGRRDGGLTWDFLEENGF